MYILEASKSISYFIFFKLKQLAKQKFLQILICLPVLTADEWFPSCSMAFILLLSKASLNSELLYVHPCFLKVVHDVTNCFCFVLFPLLYTYNLSVIRCFCFSLDNWFDVQYTSGFLLLLGYSKLWYWLCPMIHL